MKGYLRSKDIKATQENKVFVWLKETHPELEAGFSETVRRVVANMNTGSFNDYQSAFEFSQS